MFLSWIDSNNKIPAGSSVISTASGTSNYTTSKLDSKYKPGFIFTYNTEAFRDYGFTWSIQYLEVIRWDDTIRNSGEFMFYETSYMSDRRQSSIDFSGYDNLKNGVILSYKFRKFGWVVKVVPSDEIIKTYTKKSKTPKASKYYVGKIFEYTRKTFQYNGFNSNTQILEVIRWDNTLRNFGEIFLPENGVIDFSGYKIKSNTESFPKFCFKHNGNKGYGWIVKVVEKPNIQEIILDYIIKKIYKQIINELYGKI